MSEWGIPQGSTFGGLGGCFVEGLSIIGGLVICGLLINFSVKQGSKDQETIDNMEKVIHEPQKSEPCIDTIKFIGHSSSVDYIEPEYGRIQRLPQYTR